MVKQSYQKKRKENENKINLKSIGYFNTLEFTFNFGNRQL